ncbi:hypothetical protein CQ020_03665 [Arthrobacter sp. MYb23]|uniref:hypothetical protein n=1 Tax=unclassified Arthrobacter TaxID=235627 RepID=UPI000CFB1405|nr:MULTISPECIES: hypothetical protein [unclassified Arthrobacter]PRB44318.1 hypothetical protein CQ038_03520 [Arthrobacter sp. MYb51]PRB98570.1 hypothetical protein CQ020_03665 [Arthrobacter sp. MYb23]
MSTSSTLSLIKRELRIMRATAIKCGAMNPEDELKFTRGSRTHDIAPRVEVMTPAGFRRLDLLPRFSHLTRLGEVLMALRTATATIKRLDVAGRK